MHHDVTCGIQGLESDWGDSAPSDIERELWEDSRLECWNQLASWDQLQGVTTSQLDDDLNAAWTDPWYMVSTERHHVTTQR